MTPKRVFWTASALQDLDDIYEFISEDSPQAAAHQIERILSKEQQLIRYPQSGPIQPLKNATKEYRYLVEGNYKIIYRIGEDFIYIHAIFDTRQDPDQLEDRIR